MYVSDPGCQVVMQVNLVGSSCVAFGWEGQYTGPGHMKFAFPANDRVFIFTDHSTITFLKESIILDDELSDAGMWEEDTIYVSVSKSVEEF